jgi:rare lipoprotein A
MNQRNLWTTVALSMTVLGIPSIGKAETTKGTATPSEEPLSKNVAKVGEYQSPYRKLASDAVITEIHPHTQAGRQAATLFIRNIPVLTFLGQEPVANSDTKVGVIGNSEADSGNEIGSNNGLDPVQRATVVAAKINQLLRDNVDASQISVSWNGARESVTANQALNKAESNQEKASSGYIIKVNGSNLVEINPSTRLPDTTNNLAQDALQATNRMRRLIGNASPISEIQNLPHRLKLGFAFPTSLPKLPENLPKEISIGPIRLTLKGVASFYGYDGSGNSTASGERFHPEGMTAAHRSLPFGTKVRVTNTRNGKSVVVRINDRGPFIRGRVLDLSVAAARILGMMGSGLAPVKIEVLGR